MRLAFTEDQLLFGQAVRDLLEGRCGPDLVRAAWDEAAGDRLRSLWADLAGLGLFGLLVPEAAGGLAMTELEMVPILEEVGRAAVPLPVAEGIVAAGALGSVADGGSTHLQPLLEGTEIVTASADPGALVSHARLAAAVVVAVGAETRLVPLVDGSFEPLDSVDRSRRLGRLRDGAAGDVLSVDPAPAALLFERLALGASAVLLGLCQHLLDATVDYVKGRNQFGVPIGSFQAIKHHLADALTALEFARPAVYQAAFSLANGWDSVGRDVSLAKALASEAGRQVAAASLQCHGAMGYADEYDLHLWFKRVWALAASYGDAAWHRDRIGRAIGI